jgi:hypothetical protein
MKIVIVKMYDNRGEEVFRAFKYNWVFKFMGTVYALEREILSTYPSLYVSDAQVLTEFKKDIVKKLKRKNSRKIEIIEIFEVPNDTDQVD